MATKPEEINWADGAGAVKTPAPSASKRLIGWIPAADKPPGSFVNWFWNLIQLWFTHLNGAGTYTTLGDAVLNLTDTGVPTERTFLLDEKDTDQRFGTLSNSVTTTRQSSSIAVTASSVVYSTGNSAADPAASRPRTLGAVIATYTKTALAASTDRIISDGVSVVLCYGTFVELFDHDTGVSQWTYDHGGNVNDVAMDGTRVYLVGASGTGAHYARALLINSVGPTLVWSYDHGAELFSVATNGRQCFIAGAASPSASLATMRALEALTGNDLNNEGGTAMDTTRSAWDMVQLVPVDGPSKLATDGRSVWVGLPLAAAVDIERRWCAIGTVAETAILSVAVSSISVDQSYLLVSASLFVLALEKQTLSAFWIWQQTNSLAVNAVATDGAAVFACANDAAGVSIARLWRGNKPGLWRRVDITDDFLPYRQLAIPTE